MNFALTIPTRLCFTISSLPSFALKTCKEWTLCQIKYNHLNKRIVSNAAVFLFQKLPWQTFCKSNHSHSSRTQFSLCKPNITQPREIVLFCRFVLLAFFYQTIFTLTPCLSPINLHNCCIQFPLISLGFSCGKQLNKSPNTRNRVHLKDDNAKLRAQVIIVNFFRCNNKRW